MTDSTDNNTTIVATQVEDVAPAPDSIQSSIMSFVPLVLIFVVFYFLLIRPQEKRKKEIDSMLKTIKKGDIQLDSLTQFCVKLYEKAYSGLDIINLIENPKFMDDVFSDEKRYEYLVCFNRVRTEFRNEKLLMLFILNFIFLSSELALENISFM